jgi:cyclo(L-tyrosyl-L-tyrosyl) synthase
MGLECATSAELHEFMVAPYTDRCQDIWTRGEHALIGVSPGNGYFTQHRLAALAAWAKNYFNEVNFVYADVHVDSMFAAFGYAPEHARKRANKEIKSVRRRIVHGLEQIGSTRTRFRIQPLSDFLDLPTYRQLQGTIETLLHADGRAWSACLDMVERFLRPRLRSGACATPRQWRAGLDYLKAELPFFVNTPLLVGAASSVACYHTITPLTEVLYNHDNHDSTHHSGLRAADNQAYLVVRPRHPVRPADPIPVQRLTGDPGAYVAQQYNEWTHS